LEESKRLNLQSITVKDVDYEQSESADEVSDVEEIKGECVEEVKNFD